LFAHQFQRLPVKDGAPSGRILLADVWWRDRSGKKLSCKRKKRNKHKGKMFSHCNWICASRKHIMYGSLRCLKNSYFHNCWNLIFCPRTVVKLR